MATGAARLSVPSTAVWILAVLATIFFLRTSRQLLIPIVIAVLISYALDPIVRWLEGLRVPRLAGTAVLLLAIGGSAVWGAYSLRDDIREASAALPKAARRAVDMINQQSGVARNVREAAEELRSAAAGVGVDVTGTSGATQPSGQEGECAPIGGLLQTGVMSLVALSGHVVVIFFLVFFLLISGSRIRDRIVEIAGTRMEKIVDDINSKIERFLLVRLFTSFVVGVATWAVLAWMNVGQAAVWGVLAGVFNSIPYFGPVIVSGGLLVVGVVDSGDPATALKISGAALVITSLEGWLLDPPLMGKAERMNAVVVFLGLLLWTWIWGAWGTVLAVPMLVVIKSVADHVERLRPVSRLMAQ